MTEDNALGGLRSDVESLQRDVGRFENTLGELDKDIKALGWRAVYGAAAICGLGLLLALLVYNMLSNQVETLTDNVTQIDSKVGSISTRVAVIETSLKTMESSLSRIETALGELALKVDGSARFGEPDFGSKSAVVGELALKAEDAFTIVEAGFDEMEMENPSADHNKIIIGGTHYPKAVYNDADFSSSLLIRVSPGTSLKVVKAVGNWFEVETSKGTGYVHQRDIK